MKDRLYDFYNALGIRQCADFSLLELREQCDALERQILEIANQLPSHNQAIIEAYIDLRNDLEVESVKTAIRLGRMYPK